MALEVTVGPPRLAINEGYGVLITDQDGQVPWPTDKGFYHADTRMISAWLIYADGQPWDLLNGGNVAHYASRIFLTNRALATAAGDVPAGTMSLMIGRCIDGGIHEDIDLVNHGLTRVRFNLEIVIRSDFADLFEVKSGHIVRRGRISTTWSNSRARLENRYVNGTFERSVVVHVRNADAKPVYANGRMSFFVDMAPGAAWHACLFYEIGNGSRVHRAPRTCIAHTHLTGSAQKLNAARDQALAINTPNEEFYRFYHQSVDDMAALRLPLAASKETAPAGGVPWFVALFGRDSLIVSLQTAMVFPDMARGPLQMLSTHQAKRRDDYRDAEPGKIMHELRRGELAYFKLIPHTPYYGTADATILYPILLHSAWRRTGDEALLDAFMPTAERCLTWIDRYGDRDGDGFQEYQTRSSAGYENMGWKDSGEALVYPDGSLVKGPKALCELQGYVYDAWLRMAEIFEARDKPAKARALRRKAQALFERFNAAFWDEESGFYAFCLDGEKKPVFSVASNPGHLLWSGIVPRDRAARVVERLMKPDMSSGWGIRTLSAEHPAFNPHSYQNGPVWPHDNGIIATGFRRYGFVKEACQIARDVSGAAGYFVFHQMPELYSGLQRDPTNFPVQYLGANVPQAWAAGSCFSLLQMILGFQPDAPNDRLYLDPALPAWLPELEVRGLHVGKDNFDLRFWRDGEATRWEVLSGKANGVLHRSFDIGPMREH